MGKKLVLLLVALIGFSLFLYPAQAAISIGVKPGDWMEYNVTSTGTPPPEHDVVWARLEVLSVNGYSVEVNSTTQARNGTVSSLIMTLNVDKGEIGAWWIIPANLSPGDTFYDSFLNLTVTIQGQEQREFAGAVRTVTNATIPTRTKLWDKASGMFLVSMDDFSNYTIDVRAYATNIWSPQILGLDPTVLYAIIAVVVVVVVLVVAYVALRGGKKRHAPQ